MLVLLQIARFHPPSSPSFFSFKSFPTSNLKPVASLSRFRDNQLKFFQISYGGRFATRENGQRTQMPHLYEFVQLGGLADLQSCVLQVIAYMEPTMEDVQPQDNSPNRRPCVLLVASGSVAAIKFGNLCLGFFEWADVKAVATQPALHFIDKASIPNDVTLCADEHEWSSWKRVGDNVLHIDLRRWANIMVIAPLSTNTLGKIAGGLCDNLLTCIVRAWDYDKPIFIAPTMNTFMWTNPFTEKHLMTIDDLGITLIPHVHKRLACGDFGNGAIAEPSLINSTVRLFLESRGPPGSVDV